jgi:hypothetical protein
LQKIGVGFSFFQYSITPTLHKYVEQSSVMESPLPGGKPKPGPLGLDSLLTFTEQAAVDQLMLDTLKAQFVTTAFRAFVKGCQAIKGWYIK